MGHTLSFSPEINVWDGMHGGMRLANSAIRKAQLYRSANRAVLALWRALRPCLLVLLAVLEALDDVVAGALWRFLCYYSSELSEHEARQILRATQRKRIRKQKSCIPSSPIGFSRPPHRPRAPER